MHCPLQLASERTSNLERFGCGIEVSDETESVAKHLPVPPDQKIVDPCFLLSIVEEFQDAAIKALGVSVQENTEDDVNVKRAWIRGCRMMWDGMRGQSNILVLQCMQ